MQLIAKSTTGSAATFGFSGNSQPASWNYRDNLTGQSLTIDVLLTGGWSPGYLELRIVTSYHEAAGGRPAGGYVLSYQFVPPGGKARRVAHGLPRTLTIPAQPNSRRHPPGAASLNPSPGHTAPRPGPP